VSVSANVIFGAVIGLSFSVWPGEGLSRSVRGVVRGGFAGGLAAGAGCVAANLVAVLALCAVLMSTPVSALLTEPTRLTLEILCGVVLVVFGWRLMEDHTAGALHRDREGDYIRTWSASPFLDRFFASFLTPRWHLLWWLAGAGMLLGPIADGRIGVASFAAGLTVTGLGVRLIIALRLSEPDREWALSDRVFRIVTASTGLAVVGLGFLVGLQAVGQIYLEPALKRIVESVFG